jgi:predicted acylesterase/phospholipase RssA
MRAAVADFTRLAFTARWIIDMKMDFSRLEYIAFEGGGGKGAVYKGAIVALEELFDASWKKGACSKIVGGELTTSGPDDGPGLPGEEGGGDGASILDYYVKDGTLKIKGISGSSAGAITAFPLALGLTSDDIGKILTSFPFQEELLPNHNLNEGKYRMVGMDGDGKAQILVGEDRLRRLGEENVADYQVRLFGGIDAVGSNGVKSMIRSTVVAAGFSVIFTGLIENWGVVRRIAHKVGEVLEKFNYFKQASAWLKDNVVQDLWSQVFENPRLVQLLTSFTPVSLNAALKQLLRLKPLNRLPWGPKHGSKIKGVLPKDNIVSAVANILWDRGIYAGFEVREMFFKILLLAVSTDTHFSRGLQKRTTFLESMGLSQKDIERFTLTFNDRFEVERPTDGTDRGTLERLKLLQERLTFKELYDITKVNLIICVTNVTTAQPIYFSHYFAPDFPVLEAVGASMTFPVAFKPVYNEANVLLHAEAGKDGTGGETTARSFLNPSDFVKFRPHGPGARVFKESFSMRKYNKHLGIVLAYVKKTSDELAMSVNGNLSFRSFLPYLRAIIEKDSFKPFEVRDEERDVYETYDGGYMKALCYFYYNSAFKGLLFDGGATNNLPVAIFTLGTAPGKTGKIQDLNVKQATLSLKLDNSFPSAIRNEAFDLLEKDAKTLERVSGWDDEAAHRGFAERVFRRSRMQKALKGRQKLSSLPGPAWVKVSRELVAEYQRTLGGFTPWNRDMNIVAGLVSALQFGFDQGQIESIADNENIIPLYCYGIGTLDFEFNSKDMAPLVEMAVEDSKTTVLTYFGR